MWGRFIDFEKVHIIQYIQETIPLLLPVGTFSLWCHPKFEDRCHSVVEFIERAIMHSKNGKFLYFLRSRVPGETTQALYQHPAPTDQKNI